MVVRRFEHGKDDLSWNNFLDQSKNKTFLFHRSFMDYHRDRFDDFSLMVFDDKNNLKALVPANLDSQNKTTIISHQGLTYGGIVIEQNLKIISFIDIFHSVLKFLRNEVIENFHLKNIPSFYNDFHTDEVEYVLFLINAELYRRDIALVIDREHRIPYTGNIKREGIKAEKAGIKIEEDCSFENFWTDILAPNLQHRFNRAPVHSLEEIKLLKSRFPDNIKLFTANMDEDVVAGALLFIEKNTIHCQYISSNDKGRRSGALNYLFCNLTDHLLPGHRFFDFGIVNEYEGRELNRGLLFWKESFGGRAVKHDFYSIKTAAHTHLQKYLN
jgi:hypothetical protein